MFPRIVENTLYCLIYINIMGKGKNKRPNYLLKYKIEENDHGKGGNANVHICSHIDDPNNRVALKELKRDNLSKEKKARFLDEIHIMTTNCDCIEGILPILDYSEDYFWYTMPIATLATEYIKNNNFDIIHIVEGVIQLADTLISLHNKDISHRDIKPANIYYYNDKYCLGDFGLVDHPENSHDFTRSDRGLGAIFTIAPEMKRHPKDADGKKADVYSLAKTLWMFLTLDEKGFDGPYNFLDESYSLRFNSKYKQTHLVELENLLLSATQNAPEERPTMEDFKQQLIEWERIYNNGEESQLSDWNFLHEYLFKGTTPENTSWSKVDDIVKILNIIGNIPAYNHMFFSNGGGLDFEKVKKAGEKDCIYVYASGFCHVVKPKRLYFCGFEDFTWNYFLLELDTLAPIFDCSDVSDEYLVEDYPGHYVSAQYAQYGVYDYDMGNQLPSESKVVYRYLGGKFLVTLKFGIYNSIQATYDGRHGDCSNEEFREYIEGIIDALKRGKQNGLNKQVILRKFNINPFKKKEEVDDFWKLTLTNPSPDEFIKENYLNWCFADRIDLLPEQQTNNIRFYFEFEGVGSPFHLFNQNGFYLSSKMHIKELKQPSYDEIYTCNNRENAIKVQKMLNDKIKELCETNGFEYTDYKYYFSIHLVKDGSPNHLFTKEEIKILLKNADDRQTNQLVIDENGYAKLINNPQHGTLYPVRHESWGAGKVYVGKYSSLSHLQETYISSLEGWLNYLETGENVFQDSISRKYDKDELIKKIEEYYPLPHS